MENQITSIGLFIGFVLGTLCKANSFIEKTREEKIYEGYCHCRAVQFKVTAPKHLVAWNCNCSICQMKKNWHFIVPLSKFRLLTGHQSLTEYTFNTKVAKHKFCKHCGVQAYYHPRSNPDGCAITLACINPNQIESIEIRTFDGQNWEEFYGISGIQKYSKTT